MQLNLSFRNVGSIPTWNEFVLPLWTIIKAKRVKSFYCRWCAVTLRTKSVIYRWRIEFVWPCHGLKKDFIWLEIWICWQRIAPLGNLSARNCKTRMQLESNYAYVARLMEIFLRYISWTKNFEIGLLDAWRLICSQIRAPSDFERVKFGGCSDTCSIELSCGHQCSYFCHTKMFDHYSNCDCTK